MPQRIFILLMFVCACVSADGFPDPSLSGNGKVSTAVTTNNESSQDIVVGSFITDADLGTALIIDGHLIVTGGAPCNDS